MEIHLLSGFLGSGKTTAIQQACRILVEKEVRVGVITNDQGIKLVDGFLFNSLGVPERQVGNGCFCCNYNELDKSIQSLIETNRPDVLFAESVGSCTDIIATVVKPLLKFRTFDKVTLSTMVDARLLQLILNEPAKVFQEDIEYIFFKQLEEAEIIVLNKTDLIDPAGLKSIQEFLTAKYAGKKLITQNSLQPEDVEEWLGELAAYRSENPLTLLEVDYDKYASGEAQLGYLDLELLVTARHRDAEHAAVFLMKTFMEQVDRMKLPVGHIKYWLNNKYKISFTSTTASPEMDEIAVGADTCSLLINARVQVDPDSLNALMKEAIRIAEQTKDCTVEERSSSFFRPGYPKPVHRIES